VTNREILRLVGRNVRQARLKANLTQECLAELVGVHWQTISYIEQGKFPCSLSTFARLSQYLQISPNRLLDGLPGPDPERVERITKVLARKRRPRKLAG
jgi:DNA-binding XRE family transcriptional regulator